MVDWETLYRENVTWVFRLMIGSVGNHSDAEDLTTEVFLLALPRLREEASIPQIRAYLKAIARTVLAHHWRSRSDRDAAAIELARTAGPEAGSESADRSGPDVERILQALPERYRTVLRLRFLHGCSVRETAAELGISVTAAKVVQHRALRRAAQLRLRAAGS